MGLVNIPSTVRVKPAQLQYGWVEHFLELYCQGNWHMLPKEVPI